MQIAKKFRAGLFSAVLMAVGAFSAISHSSHATVVEFVPPNDTVGNVFTINRNDAWDEGRGIVFRADQNFTLNSVGVFQDLTNIDLSFEIAEVETATGVVTTNQNILRSGNTNVTTTGLEFIDFGFSTLELLAGTLYHLEFTFSGDSNQNFFYNNANAQFSQDGFSVLDGTSNGNTSNTVVAAFRLNAPPTSVVPLPAALPLYGSGLAILGFISWRRKRKAVVT